MKNTHIRNLGEEIDPETRLEVYKKVLENGKDKFLSIGLCIVLPMTLWDLNHYLDEAPDGENYDYGFTPLSFPELTEDVLNVLDKAVDNDDRNELRIAFLKQWISDLESMLSDAMDSYNK